MNEHIIYTDNENKLFHILSLEGEELETTSWEQIHLEDIQQVDKILPKEDKLWLLGKDSERMCHIIEVDLENEVAEIILTEVIISFDFISDEKLVVVLSGEETDTINEYDLNTKTINELTRIEDDTWNVKYDKESHSIFYCGYKGL